ncbi:hypothetical protein K469DRAFT_692165 [Zopfia rhizophila CBS 207.26]|uniref:Uncharacterized protein n=1 Tax=Zopfia rhizophila CBS 207.26 TaxID=1314779 RepID=A0A6A6DQN7_9PEZI|nr:hypothetical protein K469DRAFT_692165 [Zopfia rhizophila CBS 207.26]
MQLTYSNLSSNQMAHDFLWKAIFKDESWLQLANIFHINPVLLGPDLQDYCNGTKKTAYMVLLVDDRSGDLRYDKDEIFDSLQEKHKYNKATKEVIFDCGITLNVTQIVMGCDEIEMDKLERLFEKNKLRTTYSTWVDRQNAFRIIEPPNVIWIKELERSSPLFCLNLSIPGQRFQQIFKGPHVPKVIPIIKDRGPFEYEEALTYGIALPPKEICIFRSDFRKLQLDPRQESLQWSYTLLRK